MIISHLSKLINNKNNSSEYKIQLIIGLNFININAKEKIRTFYVRSNNEEIRSGNDTNDIFTKICESTLNNYENEEQILRNGSNYIFESVDILNIHFHKIDLSRDSSYIESPQRISSKKQQ